MKKKTKQKHHNEVLNSSIPLTQDWLIKICNTCLTGYLGWDCTMCCLCMVKVTELISNKILCGEDFNLNDKPLWGQEQHWPWWWQNKWKINCMEVRWGWVRLGGGGLNQSTSLNWKPFLPPCLKFHIASFLFHTRKEEADQWHWNTWWDQYSHISPSSTIF